MHRGMHRALSWGAMYAWLRKDGPACAFRSVARTLVVGVPSLRLQKLDLRQIAMFAFDYELKR
jgi:hypothetical protein